MFEATSLLRHARRFAVCLVSVFEAMFSGRHENSALRDKDGEYVIDRVGTNFEYIAVVTLPQDEHANDELAVEADYYGLEELVRAIKRPMLDVDDFVPEKVRMIWAGEEKIRTAFRQNRGGDLEPHQGLIPLFDPDHGPHCMPLKFEPIAIHSEKALCSFGLKGSH
jgi:hypothetical protein